LEVFDMSFRKVLDALFCASVGIKAVTDAEREIAKISLETALGAKEQIMPWDIPKERVVRVFIINSREDAWRGWDDAARDFVVETINNDKMPIVILAFPKAWSDTEEWYEVKSPIVNYVSYMNVSRGNQIMIFGKRETERGLKQENISLIKERFGIEFDIPAGYRFMFFCEFPPEWAGLPPLDPKAHLDKIFKETFGY
jgi:hypothetical protein